jgi:hypothetical protein
MAENVSMIGYTRVSKADGSQVHHLQHDALVAAGVDPKRIYKDSISGMRGHIGIGLMICGSI